MKRLLGLSTAALMAVSSLVAVAAPAQAADRVCRGTLTKARIAGNVIVPAGGTCRLQAGTVDGDVKVGRNANFAAVLTRIDGNVQATGHRYVELRGAVIDGNIQLDRGLWANIRANRVDGDIQLFSNRGTHTVALNRVDGNLQCRSNARTPNGGKNVVKGNKENQCRRL